MSRSQRAKLGGIDRFVMSRSLDAGYLGWLAPSKIVAGLVDVVEAGWQSEAAQWGFFELRARGPLLRLRSSRSN